MNNGENSFKTQVELDVMLDRNDNYEIETNKMDVLWNLELEMRKYGVKSTIITVPDQTVTLSIKVWGDDEDTYEEMTLNIKDVVVERSSNNFDFLVPQKLSFFRNKWTLEF